MKLSRFKIFVLTLSLMVVPLATFRFASAETSCVDGTVNKDNGSTAQTCETQFVANPAGTCNSKSGDCIADDIQLAVNFLSIGVGIVITIMIVFSGLQYMTSRDNPQAVQAAKSKIINAVVALVAFVFVYAFLQWVVPGGIFH